MHAFKVDPATYHHTDRYPAWCPDVVGVCTKTQAPRDFAGIQIGRIVVRPPATDGTNLHGTVGCVVQFVDGGCAVVLRRTERAIMLADDLSRFARRDLVGIHSPDDLRIAIGDEMFQWTRDVIRLDRLHDRTGPDWRAWLKAGGG